MAVIIASELTDIRQGCEKSSISINYNKTQINVAAQAVEDWFQANQSSLSAAIDAATSPLVLTNAQKKLLVAWWLFIRHLRDK